MRTYLTSLMAAFISIGCACGADADFWFLRTDHKTADALTNALSQRKLEADEFGKRIEQLVSKKTLTELAHFKTKLEEGKALRLEEDKGLMEFKQADEVMSAGVFFDVSISDSGKPMINLDYRLQLYEKAKRMRYTELGVQAMARIPAGNWEIVHQWKNQEQVTMILGRIETGQAEVTPKAKAKTGQYMTFDFELREVKTKMVEAFKDSDDQAKAAEILRADSELLRSGQALCFAGGRVSHDDSYWWLHEIDDEWTAAPLGFYFTLTRRGNQMAIEATWSDPGKLREKPEYEFASEAAAVAGKTTVFEPEEAKGNSQVVILVTPKEAGM